MTYYAALDVSLRSTHVCVIDDLGEIAAEGRLDSEAADIVAFLDELQIEIAKVGLEAGTLTQYLTYGLQFAGYEVICMEARQVKNALSAMRNKTDKNDARGIAQLLRSGWYRAVHIKSIDSHHIRALLASRKAVLDKCVDLENEIRGRERHDDPLQSMVAAQGLGYAARQNTWPPTRGDRRGTKTRRHPPSNVDR